MNISIKRVDQDYHFIAENETGNQVHMDANTDIGGHNMGATPMQMLLIGLGGCSGIDVVMILRKMKQNLTDISMQISGERDTTELTHSVWKDIHVHFKLSGDLDQAKTEKAIKLSMEKYCSVSRMLEKTAKITWDYEIHPS
jgi:putative redox protein